VKGVIACEIGVKAAGALREIELGDAAHAGEAQLRKLQYGIFGQICSRAVFKFNFGHAALRCKNIALLQGQIYRRVIPGVVARM